MQDRTRPAPVPDRDPEPDAGLGSPQTAWIFGYGSLLWRPDFPAMERLPVWIEGMARRFYQGSTDHRGVPGRPGRVVTLVDEPGARTYGLCFRVGANVVEAVLGNLDEREKGGYARREVTAWPVAQGGAEPPPPIEHVLVYVATSDNENWLGPAPVEEMAAQVRKAEGPSGRNEEYVRRLADSLRQLGVEDHHVFELEAAL